MKLRSRIVAFVLLLVLFTATMSTTVEGVLKDIKLGLDLQGGFEVLYEVHELKEGQKLHQKLFQRLQQLLVTVLIKWV